MRCLTVFSLLGLLVVCPATAQTAPDWPVVGQLKTRDAKEIKASTWSIGGETLDRDYTDYQSYKTYLGPLGAKRIRLQGGWAKCEKAKAEGRPEKYDFAWLDAIVADARSQGVTPWIELSYGNPIYEGGGQAKLAGGIPTSPEALTAWDNWVRAMVIRYKDNVPEWAIWNEPDLGKNITGEQYADFYIRTAENIRAVFPEARLMAFSLAYLKNTAFVEPLLKRLQRENKRSLATIFTYHGYAPNPDDSYPLLEQMERVVAQYHPTIEFMQGENGAPSTPKELNIGFGYGLDFTELTQAKWDLRRMLGDHGRGIATNLFSISDMHYRAGDYMAGINSKGLLKTNPDKTIDRPKLSYRAAQHVFSLFDDQLETLVQVKPTVDQETANAFAYRHKANGGSLVTLWNKEARPAEIYAPKATTLTVQGQFSQPVFVDLITGKVYELPKSQWSKKGGRRSGTTHTFTGLPVPDYPVLVADKAALSLK